MDCMKAAAEPPPAVVMNPLDATLDIVVHGSGNICSRFSDTAGVYAYLTGGCRANVGLTQGRAHFKVRISQSLSVSVPSSEDLQTAHAVCVGVSWADVPVHKLGEAEHSWSYCSTGEKASAGAFAPYCESFGPGDEIACMLDLTAAEPTLTFAKNGALLGVAHKLPRPSGPAQAFFPHVLIKNTEVKLDFGSNPSAWHDKLHDYPSWQAAVNGGAKRVVIPSSGVACSKCEVVMLVGLPGTGKTTWATQRAKELPAKRYFILSIDLVMEQLKVSGMRARCGSTGGFEGEARQGALDEINAQVLESFLVRAPAVPRNYILDLRKMAPFLQAGFMSCAVVFSPPHCPSFGHHYRQLLSEGKVVSDEAMADMKANFSIPFARPDFQSITFAATSGGVDSGLAGQQLVVGRTWLDRQKKRSVSEGREQQGAKQARKLQPGMNPHGQPLPSESPGCSHAPPSGPGLSTAAEPRMGPGRHMLLQSHPGQQGQGPFPWHQGQALTGQQQLDPYPRQRGQGPVDQEHLRPHPLHWSQGPFGHQQPIPYPGQGGQGPAGQWQPGPCNWQQGQGPFGQQRPDTYPSDDKEEPFEQWQPEPYPWHQRQGLHGQQQMGPYSTGHKEQGLISQQPPGPSSWHQGQSPFGQQQPMPYPGQGGQGPAGQWQPGPCSWQQGQGSCGQLQPGLYSWHQGQSPFGQQQPMPYPGQGGPGLVGQWQPGPYSWHQVQSPFGQQQPMPYPGQGQQGLFGQQQPGLYSGPQGQSPHGQQQPMPYPGQRGQGPLRQQQPMPYAGQAEQRPSGQHQAGPHQGQGQPHLQQQPGPYPAQQGQQGPLGQQQPMPYAGQGEQGPAGQHQAGPYPGHGGQQGQWGQQGASAGSQATGVAAAGTAGGISAAGRFFKDLPSRGLTARPFWSERRDTAIALLKLVEQKRVVLVRSPSQTGKTSLLQLLWALVQDSCELGWKHVAAVTMDSALTLDEVLYIQANTSWADFWGSTCSSDPDGAFAGDAKRLLLIDEAQLLSGPEEEPAFWASIKAMLDPDRSHSLPNVAVIMFASTMRDGQLSWLDAIPDLTGRCQVQFRSSWAQPRLKLALDFEEYSELWASFEDAYQLKGLFTDTELRKTLYELTAGHVGLISAIMAALAKKLEKRQLAEDGHGIGEQALQYLLQGDVYHRLKNQRCLLFHNELKAHRLLLVKLLHSGSSGYEFGNGEEEKGVQVLRRRGMLHVSTSGRADFLTPFHRAFHLVWLYSLPAFLCPNVANSDVFDGPAGFDRFLEQSVARMRVRELQQSTGTGTTGTDRSVYKRHHQMEWYRAARAYLAYDIFIAPNIGQCFGPSGKVDFWIQFPDCGQGWAVELLMDGVGGDRSSEQVARFAPQGKYHGMPIAQHAVIDFISKPAAAEPKDGVVRVYFEDNFSSAVICLPGKEPKTVRLDQGS